MTNGARKLFIAGFLAVAPAIAQSAGGIRVCMVAGETAPTLAVLRAEGVSSRMLATAGVAVEWLSTRSAACRETAQPETVSIEFVVGTPASQHPGALAYAQPFQGSKIVVMFDRVEHAASGSSQVPNVLAHVMTHEITHLLQGISKHSEMGVPESPMVPREDSFTLMTYRPLPFTAEDIALIQRGMAGRAEGFAAAPPAAVLAPAPQFAER